MRKEFRIMMHLSYDTEIFIKRMWIQNSKCNVAHTGYALDILREYRRDIPATVDSVEWDCYNNIKVKAIIHSTIRSEPILLTGVPMDYIYQKNKDEDVIEQVDYQDYYTPLRIIYNNPATIVFWRDGTKTIVKKNEKEKYNSYNAFCAALAKKIFGTNSEVNRIVRSGYNQKVAEGQKKLAEFKKKVEKARKAKKEGKKK